MVAPLEGVKEMGAAEEGSMVEVLVRVVTAGEVAAGRRVATSAAAAVAVSVAATAAVAVVAAESGRDWGWGVALGAAVPTATTRSPAATLLRRG